MAQNPIVTIEMENGGKIVAELYPEVAPISVNNFIRNISMFTAIVAHTELITIAPAAFLSMRKPSMNDLRAKISSNAAVSTPMPRNVVMIISLRCVKFISVCCRFMITP